MTRSSLPHPAQGGEDDTIRLAPKRRRWGPPLLAAAGGGVLLLGLAAILLLRPGSRAPSWPASTATEAQILAAAPAQTELFLFAPSPAIRVLLFPSLHAQGQMLNRVAAFVEKAGLPRDRLLTDAELASAIAGSGATPDTYYDGHDYRAADLARFFQLAERDHVALTQGEDRLHALLAEQGMLAPDMGGALISLPSGDAGAGLDAPARAAILRHELSHGVYFTDAAYARYVHQFWTGTMTDRQRAAFRRFLAEEAYDASNDDLMMNETMAYMAHTPDARFFNAAAVRMAPQELDALRAAFDAGMPPGWLRDATPMPASLPGGTAQRVAPRRRGRQRAGCVSSTSAAEVMRPPAARTWAMAVESAGR